MMHLATELLRHILFVGNGRCYHTIDWYRSTRRIWQPGRVILATDLIESEGHIRVLTPDDDVVNLWNIDGLLLKKQSALGNVWRNFVKLLILPLQALRLRSLTRKFRVEICHAHSMYYMYLCWLARVPYVGTPQGSEVLVRPWSSTFYRYFAVKALLAAKYVTVDSGAMRDAIVRLCGTRAIIVQNGIDVTALRPYVGRRNERTQIVSIRNIFPIYRTVEILAARETSRASPPLILTYSSWEETYRAQVRQRLRPDDRELGRLEPKTRLYEILSSALMAVSIPSSDSSPRSVYEAIFCGCAVAVTYASWVDALPQCMIRRLVVVDLAGSDWFDAAIARAREIIKEPYEPSSEALGLFDQSAAAKIIVDLCYDGRRQ